MNPKNNLSKEDKFYETERLLIRPISLEDADVIFELYNMPNFIKFIGDKKTEHFPMQKIISETDFYLKLKDWVSEII